MQMEPCPRIRLETEVNIGEYLVPVLVDIVAPILDPRSRSIVKRTQDEAPGPRREARRSRSDQVHHRRIQRPKVACRVRGLTAIEESGIGSVRAVPCIRTTSSVLTRVFAFHDTPAPSPRAPEANPPVYIASVGTLVPDVRRDPVDITPPERGLVCARHTSADQLVTQLVVAAPDEVSGEFRLGSARPRQALHDRPGFGPGRREGLRTRQANGNTLEVCREVALQCLGRRLRLRYDAADLQQLSSGITVPLYVDHPPQTATTPRPRWHSCSEDLELGVVGRPAGTGVGHQVTAVGASFVEREPGRTLDTARYCLGGRGGRARGGGATRDFHRRWAPTARHRTRPHPGGPPEGAGERLVPWERLSAGLD